MWRSQGWGCRPRRPLLCHNGCRDITQVVNTVTDLWHVRNESILSNKMTSGGLFLHQRPPSTGIFLYICYLQYDCSNEALWDHLLIITWHPTVQIAALVVCCVGRSKYHLVPHTLHYTIVWSCIWDTVTLTSKYCTCLLHCFTWSLAYVATHLHSLLIYPCTRRRHSWVYNWMYVTIVRASIVYACVLTTVFHTCKWLMYM